MFTQVPMPMRWMSVFRRDLISGSVFSTLPAAFMRSKIGQTLLRAISRCSGDGSWAAWRAGRALRPGRERRGEGTQRVYAPDGMKSAHGLAAMCEPSCTSRSSWRVLHRRVCSSIPLPCGQRAGGEKVLSIDGA